MSVQNNQESEQLPPADTAFVIFNHSLQRPKHETTDGRFPPSYEEAIGVSASPSSVSANYGLGDTTSAANPPPYSTWVNPDLQQDSFAERFRRSVYSSEPEPSEPYLNATIVTTR